MTSELSSQIPTSDLRLLLTTTDLPLTTLLTTQASSVKRSAPRAGFGTAGRFDYIDSALKAMNTPGPGSYSI